jgi:hypothetical protein
MVQITPITCTARLDINKTPTYQEVVELFFRESSHIRGERTFMRIIVCSPQ